MPKPDPECDYCNYLKAVREVEKNQNGVAMNYKMGYFLDKWNLIK
ncbi:MAG: hypothetical protein US30_C0006G0047 [Candidatus Moranbacteria bacterium GW2011_GWF2_36_839]|nr:MAG: hypothetical protein US27_C0006G0054 [Candidatus Moranbacteria bacterium GW2011_GWF1_36_78]KKQ17158.1 MAG: hypothetical protein US30_C0006G0047 [Candidatus Moranbacteria bacterium GW2011_GWF2_36_839]